LYPTACERLDAYLGNFTNSRAQHEIHIYDG